MVISCTTGRIISANGEETKPDKEEKRIRLNTKEEGMKPNIEKEGTRLIDVEKLPDAKGSADTEKLADIEGSADT